MAPKKENRSESPGFVRKHSLCQRLCCRLDYVYPGSSRWREEEGEGEGEGEVEVEEEVEGDLGERKCGRGIENRVRTLPGRPSRCRSDLSRGVCSFGRLHR